MGLPLTIKYRRHINDAISVKCWKLDEINTRLITVKIRTVALLTVYSMWRKKMKNNKWYAHCSLCDPDEWCDGWSSLKNQELCSTTAKKSMNEARLSSTGPEPLVPSVGAPGGVGGYGDVCVCCDGRMSLCLHAVLFSIWKNRKDWWFLMVAWLSFFCSLCEFQYSLQW